MAGKRVPARRRGQRGSIILAANTPAAASGGIVVLSAVHSFSSTHTAGTTSGVNWETDGGLTEFDSQGNTDIDGEWWSLEPVGGIGSNYDVEALSVGKINTWTFTGAADDTPVQMNAQRNWGLTVFVEGSLNVTQTFEVQLTGTGAAEDSAVITCTATFTV